MPGMNNGGGPNGFGVLRCKEQNALGKGGVHPLVSLCSWSICQKKLECRNGDLLPLIVPYIVRAEFKEGKILGKVFFEDSFYCILLCNVRGPHAAQKRIKPNY